MNEFRTKLRESCDNRNIGIFTGWGEKEKPEENIISSGISIIKWIKKYSNKRNIGQSMKTENKQRFMKTETIISFKSR